MGFSARRTGLVMLDGNDYVGTAALRLPQPESTVPLYREPELMTPDALTRRMTRLAYQFAHAEEMIREGRFIPVDDPITCSWCPYRQRCQDSLVDDFEAAQIRQITLEPAA